MKNSQIKILTKGIINGSVGKSSLFIIMGLCTLILFTALPVVINQFVSNRIISMVSITVILLIYAFVRCAFRSGSSSWFRFYGKENRIGRVLFWFSPKRVMRSAGLYASLFFRKLMWTVILILPGVFTLFSFAYLAYDSGLEFNLFLCGIVGGVIMTVLGLAFRFVIVQKYFLARNIFVSNPKIKASEAIRQSREIMNGRLKKTAVFKLSFTPWILLCIGVLPMFYVWPYYRQSCALLAGEIRKEKYLHLKSA